MTKNYSLKQQKFVLIVLGAGSPKLGCQQGCVPSGDSRGELFLTLSNVQCLLTALACAQASVSMVTLLSPLLSVKSPQGVP